MAFSTMDVKYNRCENKINTCQWVKLRTLFNILKMLSNVAKPWGCKVPLPKCYKNKWYTWGDWIECTYFFSDERLKNSQTHE